MKGSHTYHRPGYSGARNWRSRWAVDDAKLTYGLGVGVAFLSDELNSLNFELAGKSPASFRLGLRHGWSPQDENTPLTRCPQNVERFTHIHSPPGPQSSKGGDG